MSATTHSLAQPENFSHPKTVTFEVRTARDSKQGVVEMAQFLATLPAAPHGWKFWQKAPAFTLEYLNQGQTIYSFVTVPTELAEYARGQIVASYPESIVTTLEHQPLAAFDVQQSWAGTELRLIAPTYLPLRVLQGEGPDPLANVLAALSKLKEGEQGLIQIQARKAASNWGGRYTAALSSTTEGSRHPHQMLVQNKIKQVGFEFRLSVVVQAASPDRAHEIVRDLGTAYGAYQSEANALKAHKVWWRPQAWFAKVMSRSLPLKKKIVSVDELATLFHFPNASLATTKNIAWGKTLLGEPPANVPTYTHTPEDERNNINLFGSVEFKNKSEIFGIRRLDRRRHMYVMGKSGTGKSTLLANMIINDLKHGEGLAVVDPHGDLIETVLNYIPKHRINDVIVFDPADPEGVVKMNLFEGGSVVHRELVASGIVAIFQKMYGNSWGPRLEYILRNSLLTLLERNAKLGDVLRILTDFKYRERIVDELQDPVLKNFWLFEYNAMNDRLRTDAISPILNKVGQFVTSPLIRNVVNTRTSSFDIEQVMNQGKILLVNVSQGKLGEDNAALLGAMIITKLQLAAMNRVYVPEETRRDFYLYIDEFQNFATTSFIKILSEARKYRLNLTLTNQYITQIPEEVQAAIFGNAGTLISFIVGAADADKLQKEYGGKFTPEDLVSLGRYQIITKLMVDGQVSRPFPASTLPLAASRNSNREKVLRVSRERWARKIEK